MDENYENRPPAKNSGVTTAQKAGVKKINEHEHDEETEAFLASIQHNSKDEGGTKTYVKHKPQSVVIPPPPPSRSSDEKSSSSSSFDSMEYKSKKSDIDSSSSSSPESSSSGFDSIKHKNSNSGIDSSDNSSSSSGSYPNNFDSIGYKNSKSGIDSNSSSLGSSSDSSDSMEYNNSKSIIDDFDESQPTDVQPTSLSSLLGADSDSVLNMNDVLDDDNDEGTTIKPTQQSEADSGSYNATTKTKTGESYDSEHARPDSSFGVIGSSGPGHSISSSTQNKETTKQPASSSAFDQSMTTVDVKSVYKDAFYRWNHPFRHDELEEINGGIDVPVFWRIPRSASGVIEATMSYCYGLTLANALGAGFQDEVCYLLA